MEIMMKASSVISKKAATTFKMKLKFSLHALTEGSTTRTIRASSKIGPHALVVLIDNGSTHNFINEKVAKLLKLPVVPTINPLM